MSAYYNEIDPFAAQWLRNLISAGHIAPGYVDERSIADVQPEDLRGYTQCHFFAGIGGWSIALRLAGWPDNRPVWTGSCPCQPFSVAGKNAGGTDERHLWPRWFRIISECRPGIVFGEQVAAAIGWGWLDAVCVDLEAEGYATGAAVLPACGVGGPHIRNRLWFVADAGHWERKVATECTEPISSETSGGSWDGGSFGHMADTNAPGRRLERSGGLFDGEWTSQRDDADGRGEGCMVDPASEQVGISRRAREPRTTANGGLAHTDGGHPSTKGLQRGGEHGQREEDGGVCELGDSDGAGWTVRAGIAGNDGESPEPKRGQAALQAGYWNDVEWLPCTDGKARPTKPGLFPLAHGVQRRASKLRAYGNAIVPQVAAEFIIASMEI